MTPLVTLLVALLSDALSPGPPRDLRSAIVRGLEQRGVGLRQVRDLRDILAEPLGKGHFAAWPASQALPPAGLRTRFDLVVPHLLRWLSEPDVTRRQHEAWWRSSATLGPIAPGMDVPLPVSMLADYAQAVGPDALEELDAHTALEAARRWWSDQVRHVQRRGPVPHPERILATWPDGAVIAQLIHPLEFDEEGLSMNHCLRRHLHYYDDHLAGDIWIGTYRDPHGVPQATFEIAIDRHGPDQVVQLQGPQNGPIGDPDARARLSWYLVEHHDLAGLQRWSSRLQSGDRAGPWGLGPGARNEIGDALGLLEHRALDQLDSMSLRGALTRQRMQAMGHHLSSFLREIGLHVQDEGVVTDEGIVMIVEDHELLWMVDGYNEPELWIDGAPGSLADLMSGIVTPAIETVDRVDRGHLVQDPSTVQ